MSKVELACVKCGAAFARQSSSFSADKPPQYCSLACVGAARTAGEIGAKHKTRPVKNCEVCGSEFSTKSIKVARRFCAEACRQEAFRRGAGRSDAGKPRPIRLRGSEITCIFCATVIYRKASELSRNIGKTCGKKECVSAYGRSMWGLAPREVVVPRAKRQRKENFTAAQKMEWIGTACARCGATTNLALDHIIPVCAGGQSGRENAQTLCQPCNNWKAIHVDRPLTRKQSLSGG